MPHGDVSAVRCVPGDADRFCEDCGGGRRRGPGAGGGAAGVLGAVLRGRVLLNLSSSLAITDPGAAVEAARSAAGNLRGAGDRDFLVFATVNLVQALLMLGDWDTAEEELTQAADSGRLADHEFLSCHRGLLAALRGDVPTAETILTALQDLRASEDPQDKALVSTVEAFTAAARGRPQDALGHARAALDHFSALGIGHDDVRWAWPLAARCAHELDDTNATGELIALLDANKPGRLAPMERAERDLVRARLAARDQALPSRTPSPACAS
jgi:tetratricopeptide (TPR) repeat protein